MERFAGFRGVRFEIVQGGGPKWFVLSGNESTIAEILDYAQTRSANVSRLKRRMWRSL